MTSADAGGLVHLRAAGASLLLDARGPGFGSSVRDRTAARRMTRGLRL